MKKIRIEDVAKQAGVSNATVSRALNQKDLVNPQTYAKIMEAMNSLGYKPAENVARFASMTTSRLIIVDIPTYANPFYSDIIAGIENTANKNNYKILINSMGFDNLLSICSEMRIAGIITLSGYSAAQLDKLVDLCPVVQCCEYCKDYPLPYVSVDDYKATKNALNYLLTIGKKKFAIINLSSDYKFVSERGRAFSDFLYENNLEINDDFNIKVPYYAYSLLIPAINLMLSKEDRPDAIFAVSDVFATAAVKVALELNIKIPEELAIIGFDNLPFSEIFSPTITSVKQPRFTMASMACEFLLEKIRKPEIANKQYLLETKLIIRETTLKKEE